MVSYLTIEEMEHFKKYRHAADKTTLETFYCTRVFNHVEKALPNVKILIYIITLIQNWSANAITILG